MPRPSSAVKRIIPSLTKFIELGCNLPVTNTGKVNVAQLCKKLHELDQNVKPSGDAQHFHTKPELKDLVNTVATEQGVLPIGHGAVQGEVLDLEQRLNRSQKQAKEDAQAAIEATASHEALFEELQQARKELETVKLERDAAIEKIKLIKEGGFLFPSLGLSKHD